MRNPNRIQGYTERLANIWRMVPDWRISQLMTNAMYQWSWANKGDPFYAEDEEFIQFLENFVKETVNVS